MLDVSVWIAALLSRRGTPAELVRLWRDGGFDVVVSPLLLDELDRVLAYPKIRARIGAADAEAFVKLLREQAQVVDDPTDAPPQRSVDANDDYLVALARTTRSILVSGDGHLLGMADQLPVYAPAGFLAFLRRYEAGNPESD